MTPNRMTPTRITPEQARQRIAEGAMLVDIRGRDEFARERIAGAVNHPVDGLARIDSRGAPVVFHCKSGGRTDAHAARLASAAGQAYVVDGGIEAWKKAGLPVVADKSKPIELMRQVQIVAGSLVLLGAVMSMLVAPGWIYLSAFVGAGLVFAGATGWCGMARLLALMPWNARTASAG